MENIFEGAKFGDKFVTRDGKMALYVNHSYNLELMDIGEIEFEEVFLEDRQIVMVRKDGVFDYEKEIESPFDIVGKWEDDINDEKLGNIMPSRHQIQDYLDDEGYLDENGYFIDTIERAVQIGFEMCYNKLKK